MDSPEQMKSTRRRNSPLIALALFVLLLALVFASLWGRSPKEDGKNHHAGRVVKQWTGTFLEVDPSVRPVASISSPKTFAHHGQAAGGLDPSGREEVTIVAPPGIFDPEVFANFTNLFRLKLHVITYTNDAALPELIARESVDLALVPSHDVSWLAEEELIRALDDDEMKAIHDTIWVPPVGRRFESAFPNEVLAYSAPYLWGTIGLAFNRKHVPGGIASWNDLLAAERPAQDLRTGMKGRIMMLDHVRDNYASALMALAVSPNTTSTNEINQASSLLGRLAPFLHSRASSLSLREALIRESVWLAQAISSDAVVAHERNPNVEFVLPAEGTHVVVFSLVLTSNSNSRALGKNVLTYLLAPRVAGEVSNHSKFASANYRAQPYVSRDLITGVAYALPPAPRYRLLEYVPNSSYGPVVAPSLRAELRP